MNGAAFVLGSDDVAKTLYDMNKNYQGQQTWRQAFIDTDLAEEKALSELKYDYSKDIAEAYAASLQNRNAILDTSLGQGYKQQAIEQNTMNLQEAFEQYRQNYLQNASKVEEQYGQIENAISGSLNEQASAIANIVNLIPEYYNKIYENNPDLFADAAEYPAWQQFVDDEGQFIPYDTLFAPGGENPLTIKNEDGSISLTEEGRKVYYRLLNDTSNTYSFQQFLNDKGLSEYVDAYMSDSANYGNKLGEVLIRDVLGMSEDWQNTALNLKDENVGTSAEGKSYQQIARENVNLLTGIMEYDKPAHRARKEIDPNDIRVRGAIDTRSSMFNPMEFGEFVGSGKTGSKQQDYIEQIVKDVRYGEDKIKVGQYIMPNYGAQTRDTDSFYQYVGNGVFVEIDDLDYAVVLELEKRGLIYTPEGYSIRGRKVVKD